MPTYEYKCDACEKTFEKFQSITAAPIKKCALCGANKARRLIGTGAGLIFKGSGFYITDYRSEGYKSKAKADSPAGSGTSNANSGGQSAAGSTPAPAAESKPAAKPAKNSKKD